MHHHGEERTRGQCVDGEAMNDFFEPMVRIELYGIERRAFLFEMLDNSLLNVALPTIGRELHASTTALQWVTGAYAPARPLTLARHP